MVFGLRWINSVQTRTRSEGFGRTHCRWWLVYLLLVTCVPFTTIVIGRFAGLSPTIWLYAGNMALIGIVSFALLHHTRRSRRTNSFAIGKSRLPSRSEVRYSPSHGVSSTPARRCGPGFERVLALREPLDRTRKGLAAVNGMRNRHDR
jgi:hypothetical protein